MAVTKHLLSVPFTCTAQFCPKQKEEFSKSIFAQAKRWPSTAFCYSGCQQIKTTVYGVSEIPLDMDEWNASPMYGCILPSPDPEGAFGTNHNIGCTKDVITESLANSMKGKPFRVAFFFLTRGYAFNTAFKGELIAKPPKPAAVSSCFQFLTRDIQVIKPDKIILCGSEVGSAFFNNFDIREFRHKRNLTINVEGSTYPVQVAHDPQVCFQTPAYMTAFYQDCEKLINGTTPLLQIGKARLLTKLSEVLDYIEYLKEYEGYISVDTETQNLNKKAENKLGTIQFATNYKQGVVIPYEHRQTPFTVEELGIIKTALHDLFKYKIAAKGWLAHNAKFEQTIFKNKLGTFITSAPVFCTQAAAFLLDETRSERKRDYSKERPAYGLKVLANEILYFDGYAKEALKHREEGTLIDLDLEELANYGAMDVYVTLRLFDQILELADKTGYKESLLLFCEKFYSPITRITAEIERNGFKTDIRRLRRLKSQAGPFEKKIATTEAKLRENTHFQTANTMLVKNQSAGISVGILGKTPWVFDFSKPEHQAMVFFNVMGLEPVSFSEKEEKPSVDKDFFSAYRATHKEVELFYQLTEVKKMRDTFIVSALNSVDPELGIPDCKMDQRIRPDIRYTGIVTGRFAMKKPNLQQIPKEEEAADEDTAEDQAVRKAVKDCYTVDKGCALIQIDYKVNEVRWVGIFAKEPRLAKVFNEAAALEKLAKETNDEAILAQANLYADIHKVTASIMFGVPLEQVTKKQRKASKTITFAILYGSSVRAVAESLGESVEETERLFAKFFANMPGVKAWMDEMHKDAEKFGYVQSLHGRRRRMPAFLLPRSFPKRQAHVSRNFRQAVNAPIQGVASDGAALGIAALSDYIENNKKNWVIQNFVHDACILQVPKNEVMDAIAIAESLFVTEAQARMEELGIMFNLPLGIDIEVGTHWGSLTKYEGLPKHAQKLQDMIIAQYDKAAA